MNVNTRLGHQLGRADHRNGHYWRPATRVSVESRPRAGGTGASCAWPAVPQHTSAQLCRAGNSSMMTILFGSVLPWLLIVIGSWLAYELIRQNGRILLRLEEIEKNLSAAARPGRGGETREPGGMQIGTVAPNFELPDLNGLRHKLSDYRKQNVLLIFFNPQCA